jgi:hypothetical protein
MLAVYSSGFVSSFHDNKSNSLLIAAMMLFRPVWSKFLYQDSCLNPSNHSEYCVYYLL